MSNQPNRLCALRRKRKLSQEQLAEILNVTQASVSLYENKGNIPIDVLAAAADYFGVTIEYIIGLSDEKLGVVRVTDDEYNLLLQYRRLPLHEKRLISDLIRSVYRSE